MESKNKTIENFANISLYESIGRFSVGVETKNGVSATETYVAEYEAKERFDSLESKEDVKNFLEENGEEDY